MAAIILCSTEMVRCNTRSNDFKNTHPPFATELCITLCGIIVFWCFFLFGWRVFKFFFMYFTNFLKLFYKTCFMQLSMLHVGCYYLLLVVAISYVKKTVLSTDLCKAKWKYHKRHLHFTNTTLRDIIYLSAFNMSAKIEDSSLEKKYNRT